MEYRFFGRNITKTCESCHFGQRSSNSNQILCEKKGVTDLYYICKKHKYNPLRRIPKSQPDIIGFLKDRYKMEDFEL